MGDRSTVNDLGSRVLSAILALLAVGGAVWLVAAVGGGPPSRERIGEPTSPDIALHEKLEAGLAAAGEGELERAVQLLESVPHDDRGYPIALLSLARIHERSGHLDAGLAVLEELEELQPESADGPSLSARMLNAASRPVEAEVAALRALELDPTNRIARYEVALARIAQDRVEEAVFAYRRAFALDSTGGGVASARAGLERLGRNRPDLAGVHYAMAYLASRAGEAEVEVRELERYLSLVPEGPVADAARSALSGRSDPGGLAPEGGQ